MAKPFFYLRKNTSKKPEIIYLGLRHHSGVQMAMPTGIKILPLHWNSKRREVKQVAFPEVDIPNPILFEKSKDTDLVSFLNNKLSDLSLFVSNRKEQEPEVIKAEVSNYLNGRNESEQLVYNLHDYLTTEIINAKASKQAIPKERVIQLINDFINSTEYKISFFDYAENFIHHSQSGERLNSGKRINERTIKKYNATLDLLKEFQQEYERVIDWNSIDKEFIDAFNSFMVELRKYSPATLGKHISILKTFIKEATEEGINNNLAFQTKAFKVIETVSDSLALSTDELNEIYSLDLRTNERLERVRDVFIIASHTGLRWSDITEIKGENIIQDAKGYYFDKIQFKTKSKVLIPLNDTVLEILNKYDFKLPEPISNQKFNEYLKEVCKLTESLKKPFIRTETKGGITEEIKYQKWELVSSHTARRSFATNAYERGVPTLSIMAITGHKTDKAFRSYIKTSAQKHAEIFKSHS